MSDSRYQPIVASETFPAKVTSEQAADLVARLLRHDDKAVEHREDYANATASLVEDAADVIHGLTNERDSLLSQVTVLSASLAAAREKAALCGAKVSPLEWHYREATQNLYERWIAYTVLGTYMIHKTPDGFDWIFPGKTGYDRHPSFEDAIAAAQSDFDTRIHSALSRAPSRSVGKPDEMRMEWVSGIENAPYASTVLASYFDGAVGEWSMSLFAAERPEAPYTHWMQVFRPDEMVSRKSAPAGIYIASKTKHADRWRLLRAGGAPIISTWIDEAGVGESSDLSDLWRRCVLEASNAEVLVIYREPEDVLKGGWVELGAALAHDVPVVAVGIEDFTIRHDARIRHFPDLDQALAYAIGLVRPIVTEEAST